MAKIEGEMAQVPCEKNKILSHKQSLKEQKIDVN